MKMWGKRTVAFLVSICFVFLFSPVNSVALAETAGGSNTQITQPDSSASGEPNASAEPSTQPWASQSPSANPSPSFSLQKTQTQNGDPSDSLNAYNVTFDSQGGSAVADMTGVNSDSTISQPTDPTKQGYTFAGWYKEAACQNAWNFSTDVVAGDTTLYAGWAINQYTVTFNTNGGTPVAGVTQNYNTTIDPAPVTSKPGFTFTGWYTDSTLTQAAAFPYAITENVTLYASFSSPFAQGDGSAANPFGISTPDQLNAVRNVPNASFILMNDIDMTAATAIGGAYYNSGAGWAPIAALNGTFDGGGHSIIGLQINRPGEYVGLFVNVNAGAKISNLGMVGETIYGGSGYKDNAGGICSFNYGTIQYCYNTGVVCGDNIGNSGGIAGASLSSGVISNCYNTGTIKTKNISGWTGGGGWVGGITGYNYGTLQNCFNAGSVSGMDNAKVGGITSSSSKGISNCYNIGTVASESSAYSPLIANQYSSSGNSGLYYYSADIMNGALFTQGKPGTALTGSQMTKQSSFVGFDFGSQWTMGDASYPYPELQGMPQVSIPQDTTDFTGGTGLPNSPYEISTPAQLNNVRNFTGGYYMLTNDIDMTAVTSQGGAYYNGGKGFSPIPEFYGYFDGSGHAVVGIQINRPQENVGLFDMVEPGAVVYNLEMAGSNINGGHSYANKAGGLCAQNWGDIAFCYNTGHVCGDATGETGGIAGYMSGGIISNCCNTGTITVDNESGWSGGLSTTGGIAGWSAGTLMNCFNAGSVTGPAHAGGIIGTWYGTGIYNCYNAGAVTSYQDCGALIGEISQSSNGNSDYSGLYYMQNGSIAGAGTQSSFGVGLTVQQMQDKASFAGFDFGGVWTMGTDSYPYPVLQGFVQADPPQNTADFAGGTGAAEDPYQVESAEQLNNVRNYPGACFVLENDIDISAATQTGGKFFNTGAGWDPIDNFTGQFNGNGHVISGMRIYRPGEQNIGLFATVAAGSSIHDLILKDVSVQGKDYTASLVGNNSGLVADVAAYGTVGINPSNGNYVGGITGFNTGTVQMCSNACNVSGRETGGTTGYNVGIIEKCSNSGTITGSSTGGIAGNSEGAIKDCCNLGSIKGTQGFLGGIAGDSYNNGSITNCYNTGFVASNVGGFSGGIAGSAWAQKNSNCYYVNTILSGVGDGSSQNTYSESLDALKQQSTFQGFDFDNVWAIQENSTTPYLQGNTPLYVNVAFDAQGGSAVASQTVPYNTKEAAPADPTRLGYTFAGWYRDAALTIPWDFNTDTAISPTGYIGLYAKWNPNTYTITFDSQGGSAASPESGIYNATITAPAAPYKTGYLFAGWYKNQSATNAWNFNTDVVPGNITLYAKWATSPYTVTFDSQGGSAVASLTGIAGCTTISQPAEPSKYGYTFAGWYKESDDQNVWNFSTDIVTGNTILYAKWAPNQYTLTFNTKGGTAVASITQNYNTVVSTAPATSKTGYEFSGWYADSALTTRAVFPFTVTADATLYAAFLNFAQGDGSAQNPYGVSTPEQLNAVRYNSGARYILLNDIDMTEATSQGGEYYNNGQGFEPIAQLSGTFDGNGHGITGMQVNRPNENVGLFAKISAGAMVCNLGMVNSNITGASGGSIQDMAGGICAENNGVIKNCYNTGNVTAGTDSKAGGIAGDMQNNGAILNCYNTGTIQAVLSGPSGDGFAGGIVGCTNYNNGGSVTNCFNAGSVIGNSYAITGGIVGWGGRGINNCYNAGSIVSSYGCGMLVGELDNAGNNSNNYFYAGNGAQAGASQILSYIPKIAFGTALMNGQMQQQPSFAGFDFNSVWTMGSANYPYPQLRGMKQVSFPQNTTDFAGGNGHPYSPFIISTAAQMNNIRNYSWGYFMLQDDIDLSAETTAGGEFYNNGLGWLPISDFMGDFDGEGHTISGLTITRLGSSNIGLFGSAAVSGSIHDLVLKNVTIQGKDRTGSLVGQNAGSIKNVTADGTVSIQPFSGIDCGGIVGFNLGPIELCTNDCTVSGSNTGGIAGESCGNIQKCYNTGKITGGFVGGITGYANNCSINDCFNIGTIKAGSFIGYNVGGIAGTINGNHGTDCYNVGDVTGNGLSGYVGGISGSGAFTNCYYINKNDRANGTGGQDTYSRTEDQLKQQATFRGFDFINTWQIAEGNSFPVLQMAPFHHITGITISHALSLQIGGSGTLTAQTSPANATNQKVYWTSSNTNIATVSNGVVQAIWPGTATITVLTQDGGYSDTCLVTVNKMPNTFAVTFDSQGGSAVAGKIVNNNSTMSAPAVTTRDGFIFDGWYRDAGCTGNSWSFTNDKVTGDMTLYAKWFSNICTVNFNTNGGSTIESVTALYGTNVSKPNDPTKPGYIFNGWFSDPGCTYVWNFDHNTVYDSTVTIYARWMPIQYTITFDSQGGSAVADKSANYNNTVTKPADPMQAGYTFAGWYREPGCVNPWDFSVNMVTGTTTLFAKWTVGLYAVSFNSQGGSLVANTSASYNNTISKPTDPTRTGYIFSGWYKEPGCINAWNFVTDTVTGNITLYAKWNADTQAPKLDSISLSANPCTNPVFIVVAKGVIDPSSVKTVQFAVWSENNGQDDLQWYNGVNDGRGNWTCTVNALNHKNDVGIYNIHVYGTDNAGNFGFMGMTTIDMEQREHTPPVLGSISLSANPSRTSIVKVTARGVSDPSGVQSVQFAVWSDNNGQDDLRWYNGTSDGKGNWSVSINAANHKNDTGIYHIHVYGTDKLGSFGFMGMTTVDMEHRDHTAPTMGSVLLSPNPCTAPAFKVTARGVSDDRSGVKTVQFAVWSENNGQDDLKWYTAKNDGKGNWTATIKASEHKNDAGVYNIHVYGTDKTGNQGFMGSASINIIR